MFCSEGRESETGKDNEVTVMWAVAAEAGGTSGDVNIVVWVWFVL